MRILYSLVFLFTAFTATAQYTSYDFEPVVGTQACSYIVAGDYDQTMKGTGCYFGDSFQTGHVPGVYLLDAGCDDGPPHSGSFFIGLAGGQSKSDRLSLKLADPSQINRIYTMVIHIKKPLHGNAVDLDLGYSFDCDQSGTSFQVISKPTDTLWDTVVVALSPPESTKYITITAKPSGTSSPLRTYTYIDDVQISWKLSAIEQIKRDHIVSIYPNPFSGSASFKVSESMKLPCTVSIYDITGRKVYEDPNITTRQATIDRGNLNNGMYIMELKDSNGESGRTRIMIE